MYLLTGGSAFVVGILVILFMPDSPIHANFLTRKERVIAIERVRDDQGGTENKIIKKAQVIEAVTDVRTWLIVLLTCMSEYLGFSLLFTFSPILGSNHLADSGHSERKSKQL